MEKLENDGKAVAEVLFGDIAPTGRLQSTWYKDISSLPELTEYNVPEENSAVSSMAQLDLALRSTWKMQTLLKRS